MLFTFGNLLSLRWWGGSDNVKWTQMVSFFAYWKLLQPFNDLKVHQNIAIQRPSDWLGTFLNTFLNNSSNLPADYGLQYQIYYNAFLNLRYIIMIIIKGDVVFLPCRSIANVWSVHVTISLTLHYTRWHRQPVHIHVKVMTEECVDTRHNKDIL